MFRDFHEINILISEEFPFTYTIKMDVNYNGYSLYATRTMTPIELHQYYACEDFRNRIHIELKEAIINQAKFLNIYSEYKPSNWLKEGF